MRSDYALYLVAIIFFILTGVVAAYAATQQELWIITTVVLGLVFIGLGYSQRPHETTRTEIAIAPPPPPTPPKVVEAVTEKPPESALQNQPVIQVGPPSRGLLEVKGIKEKRAQQLKAIGIHTVEDLAKASPEDLATRLKIAPYFTGKWIENAKEILKS